MIVEMKNVNFRIRQVHWKSRIYRKFRGRKILQAEFTEFLRQHIGLLQAEVSKKPALVLPMMLNVDEKRRTLSNIIKADTVHKVNKRTRKLIGKLISWCKW